MQDIVTLTHRNVCKDGFTVENSADAGMYYFHCLTAIKPDFGYSFSRFARPLGCCRSRQEGTKGTLGSAAIYSFYSHFPRKIGPLEFVALAHAWNK